MCHLSFRAAPGRIQLFRCAHEPDFVGHDSAPVCNPIRTLSIAADIAAEDVWWECRAHSEWHNLGRPGCM